MSRTEEELRNSIKIEKVTSSYLLEGRSPRGIKTSSFLSYTAKCEDGEGWSMDEARYVESCLAHQVAEDLYTDAYVRKQITRQNRDTQVQQLTPMYEALQNSRLDKVQGDQPTVSDAAESVRNPVAQS